MAKKTRSRKTKYKKRNPVAALLDGLLTLLDTLLEGVAAAAVLVRISSLAVVSGEMVKPVMPD